MVPESHYPSGKAGGFQRQIRHHAFPGPLAFDRNDPIICVAGKAMAPPFQFLVERVQQNVCQKWGPRIALGDADLAASHVLSDQHPGVQVASDQGQQALVADGWPQPVHKPVMIERISAAFKRPEISSSTFNRAKFLALSLPDCRKTFSAALTSDTLARFTRQLRSLRQGGGESPGPYSYAVLLEQISMIACRSLSLGNR